MATGLLALAALLHLNLAAQAWLVRRPGSRVARAKEQSSLPVVSPMTIPRIDGTKLPNADGSPAGGESGAESDAVEDDGRRVTLDPHACPEDDRTYSVRPQELQVLVVLRVA